MKTLGMRFIHVVASTGVRSPSRLARAVVIVQSIKSSARKRRRPYLGLPAADIHAKSQKIGCEREIGASCKV